VLEEHEDIRTGAVAPRGGVGALRVPGGAVLDKPELFDVQRLRGCAAGARAVVRHGDHATPYRDAQHAYRNAELAYRNAELAATQRELRVPAREFCDSVRELCIGARVREGRRW
jgi:hypothetical protein